MAELELLIVESPLRERLRGQQMLALYRAGRQADALRAYEQRTRPFAEELGLEPGPDLRRLEAAILDQDPRWTSGPGASRGERRIPADAGQLVRRSRRSSSPQIEEHAMVRIGSSPWSDPAEWARPVSRSRRRCVSDRRARTAVGSSISRRSPKGIQVEAARRARSASTTSTASTTTSRRDEP